MFLPALLIRDLGFWGYVVFAVPNVVGAAAMGWVLKSPESSRRLIEDHRQAAVLFSQVTLLFHAFWLSWLLTWACNNSGWPKWVWFIFVAIPVLGGTFLNKAHPAGIRTTQLRAFGTWIVSAMLLLALALGDPIVPSPAQTLQSVSFSWDVVWLLPASVFGFLFCPYLDLTFLRARAESESKRDSRFAFGAGFGIFFFSMIVLTVLYAGPIAVLTDRNSDAILHIATWAGLLLVLHMGLQTLFTIEVHLTEMHRERKPTKGPYGWFDVWWPFAFIFGLMFGSAKIDESWHLVGHSYMLGGEIFYRAFLTFYGLIFPTYVYLNIWNIRGRCLRTRTSRSTLVTLIAIVLASPFFFMGFFVRDERYIPAGVAILILAKLFTGSPDRPAPLTQPA